MNLFIKVITCYNHWNDHLIELDDGKIYTGKPQQFDGKIPHGFPLKIFPYINPMIIFNILPS